MKILVVIYMHEIAYKFCYECARDPICFPVDQKYEIINKNYKKLENRPIIMAVVP